MSFADHFSGHADAYARHRPGYPPALFAWLAGVAPGRGLAWDAGTGNGQAAHGLARHFDAVVATDASERQVAHAPPHPCIRYGVAPAHESGLRDASADLTTCAAALHWFDVEAYWREVRRVLRPGGIAAAWTYARCRVAPAVDAVVDRYMDDVVGPCWPPERRHVEAGYATLPFPFPLLAPPGLSIRLQWTADDLLAYLGTWSATRRCTRDGYDPLDVIRDELHHAWRDEPREVVWPLHLLAGRNED